MNFAILAAGEGSRLAAEGITTPKPLVTIGGKPLIGRLVGIFADCGAEHISIIANSRCAAAVSQLLQSLQLSIPISVVEQDTGGSMESFFALSPTLPPGRFVLTTVDTVFRPDELRRFIEAFSADTEADGYMAVTDYIDDEKPLYIDVDAEMQIRAFLDTAPTDAKYISGGIYALGDKALGVLNECMERGVTRMRDFQRALLAAGLRLRAWPFGKIIDVDHAADIALAESII